MVCSKSVGRTGWAIVASGPEFRTSGERRYAAARIRIAMCRSIRTLANFEPPATEDEIRASALQFVRKLSGMSRPSRANELAFQRAVDEVTGAATRLIDSLALGTPPRNREEEARKARARSLERFAVTPSV